MLSNPLVVQSNSDWPKARKFIFAICLMIFLFQLYKTTARYYRYDTEFKLKQPNGRLLDLPAITVCTDKDVVYLKSKLRSRYPSIDKELKKIDNISVSSVEKRILKENVYRRYVRSSNRNFFERSVKDTDFMECYLRPPTVYMKDSNWELDWTDCSGFSPVLESRVHSFGKCFTFFSRQQSDLKGLSDLRVDKNKLEEYVNLMSIVMSTDLFSDVLGPVYGSDTKESLFMFIHDSYRMPSFELSDAIKITAGKLYDIRFWSTTKTLLKKPFPSNCVDYQKNFNTKESPKSKVQCKHDCYVEKSAQYLGCLVPNTLLMNDDKLKGTDLNRCPYLHDIYKSQKFAKECSDSCHQDCHQTEYKFDVKMSDHHFQGIEMTTPLKRRINKFSLIRVNYKPDQDWEYRERPVQSMCDTIQMMAITLVIWFGLSIFSFTSILETAISYANPKTYYIFEDKVTPNVIPVMPSNESSPPGYAESVNALNGQPSDQPMIRPKFTPTNIGSNVKLEHYNDFVAKVVDGYPSAHTVDLQMKKQFTQY